MKPKLWSCNLLSLAPTPKTLPVSRGDQDGVLVVTSQLLNEGDVSGDAVYRSGWTLRVGSSC